MGIVNVTPDSFSDGGAHATTASALAHCERLVRDGADLLDIGGESSRPGAARVTAANELARVLPVLRGALTLGLPVSVDTCKPEVMREALALGVDIVNDIRALQAPGALDIVAAHPACGICLMHMKGEPQSMQQGVHYDDVVADVAGFLAARAQELIGHGVARSRIVLDPGIGFGKRGDQNWQALRGLERVVAIGPRVLVGTSRKKFLGELLAAGGADDEARRDLATAVTSVLAARAGAWAVRVHDAAATRDALAVARAWERGGA